MRSLHSIAIPTVVRPHQFAAAIALALGLLTSAFGAWALVTPESFAAIIAPFAPYNAHYLRDLGAFQLGLGAGLLLAACGGDGLLVALSGYALGGAAHTLSHVIDRDSGGHPADAPLLGVLVIVALVALLLRRRVASPRSVAGDSPATAATDDATEKERGTTRDRGSADRKRYAFAALWLALLAQVLWMFGQSLMTHALGEKAVYDSAIVVAFAAFAATGGRVRWLTAALRILVGIAFLVSVGDRFGLLGPPDGPGVSWGDFAHFVAYTHTVNAFLPTGWAPMLAVLATLGEVALGFALLLGVCVPHAARGAAILLVLFGVAMTLSLGIGAQFEYAVGVLAAGAWTLSTVDAMAFGLDGLLARRLPWAVRP